jgi:DnaJ-class molecular chaperone
MMRNKTIPAIRVWVHQMSDDELRLTIQTLCSAVHANINLHELITLLNHEVGQRRHVQQVKQPCVFCAGEGWTLDGSYEVSACRYCDGTGIDNPHIQLSWERS